MPVENCSVTKNAFIHPSNIYFAFNGKRNAEINMTSSHCPGGTNSLAAGEKHKSNQILMILLILRHFLEVQGKIIKEYMNKVK